MRDQGGALEPADTRFSLDMPPAHHADDDEDAGDQRADAEYAASCERESRAVPASSPGRRSPTEATDVRGTSRATKRWNQRVASSRWYQARSRSSRACSRVRARRRRRDRAEHPP